MNDDADRMPAVILAGGLATRMRPVTAHTPKALLEIAGQPFLWHQLQLLKRHGIRRVVLLVGYLGEAIENRFGNGSVPGLQIEYCHDGPTLLGTAGAIRQALPLLPGPFFMLHGDSYLPCDYGAIEAAFRRSGLPALMTVYRNEGRYDVSNVEYDGGRILAYDKLHRTIAMNYIDYGLGAFLPSVFSSLPPGACDLETVYKGLIAERKLASYEVEERFYEIGSPEGFRETEEFLQRQSRNPSDLR
ncbi:MAG TPA: nucleotidyltransferase family protein [Terriglobia bacterium]|nr:nucleotidyltransferase family protein [Terriglobia bacterium]